MIQQKKTAFSTLVFTCFSVFTAMAQLPGLGINVDPPQVTLDVHGTIQLDSALVIKPASATPAAASITIDSASSSVVVSASPGVQANSMTMSGSPRDGQLLYITNLDDDPASFSGHIIPATSTFPLVYVSSAWRALSASGGTDDQNLSTSVSGSNVTVQIEDGTDATFSINDGDTSTDNELVDSLRLTGSTLSLFESSNTQTVDLSGLSGISDADWFQALGTNSASSIDDWIYTNGNVGINIGGLANPYAALHVQSNLYLGDPNNLTFFNTNATQHIARVDNPHLLLEDIDNNTGGLSLNASGFNIATENGTIEFKTNIVFNGDFSSTGNTRMIIENAGNVGIGVSSASALLDVGGTAEINGELNMVSNKIVGVADPTAAQDAATKNYVDNALNANTESGLIDADSDTRVTVENTADDDHVRFIVRGTEVAQIDSTGRLGFGTTAPGSNPHPSARIEIADETGAKSDIQLKVAGNGHPAFAFVSQGGSLATPATVTDDQVLANMVSYAHNGSSYGETGNISFVSAATPSGDNPGRIHIGTTPVGGDTAVDRMLILENGDIQVTSLAGSGTVNLAVDNNGILVTGAAASGDDDWRAVGGGIPGIADAMYHSANVGIGNTNPSHALHVTGNTLTTGDLYVADPDDGSFHYGTRGRLGEATTFNADNDENGLWLEAHDTDIFTDAAGIFMNSNTMALWSAGDNGILRVYDEDDFSAAKFYIDNSGNVGIGTESPDQLLSVNGGASKTGGGSWSVFSDERLKHNIKSFNYGLETIKQFDPVWYEYSQKSGMRHADKAHVGIIAQDVEAFAPWMVERLPEKEVQGEVMSDLRMYNPSSLVYVLVNAVKEQQSEIELLKELVHKLLETPAHTNSKH